MAHKFFLYARKSTEDDDRQVMSIEAQLFELREFARRENLEILQEFTESKSAKTPGREVFGDMMTRIERDEAQGILAWHPDRLARNSIDGGRVIYAVDTRKLISLRFPQFWFEPTPQGLFMLQVAFGQSKYYSDNLSENIKRGIRQKLRRGEWINHAPHTLRQFAIDIKRWRQNRLNDSVEFFATARASEPCRSLHGSSRRSTAAATSWTASSKRFCLRRCTSIASCRSDNTP
jgi:DNA invertase Pin-like site-specific DNA recombinase